MVISEGFYYLWWIYKSMQIASCLKIMVIYLSLLCDRNSRKTWWCAIVIYQPKYVCKEWISCFYFQERSKWPYESLNICSELNDTVIEAQLRTRQVPPRLPAKTAIDSYLQSTNRLLILVCCLTMKLMTSLNSSSCSVLVFYSLYEHFLLDTTFFISWIYNYI